MLFNYKYRGNTSISNDLNGTAMNFAPDTFRDPTFFVGKLNKKIAFREAISALHDVVVSDLRYKPKDRIEYKAWAAEQEMLWLGEYMAGFQIEEVRLRIEELRAEIKQIHKEKDRVLGPFNKAKLTYFDYLYKNDKDAWFVLDPVITVHPDELFFECFSQDESSYGKLSCNYNVFTEIDDFKCGTTNIDYSAELYGEFQKIRGYKDTVFKIDPSGFETKTTNEEVYKEVKIDLPDSWVRGFLQVSTAMTLPATTFELHPMDVFSLCQYLRRFKESNGPRALRFILEPGKPIRLVIEPWYDTLTFSRSIYMGNEDKTIRIWGRRRLMILERLIPIAKSFKVSLLGSGLPSFFMADLGDMTFTLGLSGWTTNDWSRAGNFDLMAPRGNVDLLTKQKIFNSLKETWFASADDLAKKLGLSTSVIGSSLTSYTQAGRVIYDLKKGVYRLRELSQEPLDFATLRFSSEQEKIATAYLQEDRVKITTLIKNDVLEIKGKVKGKSETFTTLALIDKDQRLIDGFCDCAFFQANKMKKGPCEHILATRMKLQSGIVEFSSN
ncbi:SWIM zinc finger family protein [Pedobacter changchengzhani]|uniref:SWIM zinc finger family protein n=1 Tax=Pedobacter changchengzhani TaxID=2529274 RepID=A0A4R5MME3_9SPHI|nr:SWIM zinc finger family protein [Pedobacter changchengzhani]TDG36967.1 SWIM zinc finger family protein [Pedobacter changchengzhani]